MPIYEYEHIGGHCRLGKVFETRQSADEPSLVRCPVCKTPVRKLISRVSIHTPKTNTELRDLGFTKLVRRDDGVYENVTAHAGKSRAARKRKQ